MLFIPINPLLTTDGDLVSLAALRGTLRAQPLPLDEGTTVQNVVVSLGGQEISVSLAASLGVGSVFTGSGKLHENAFWLDAVAFADSPTRTTNENIVKKTRWGYGLRMMFRAQQLDASVKLSFPLLGAHVDLGLASASYEVQTIGLGAQALASVLGSLSQFGTLRGDTFHDLNTTVINDLTQLIAQHGTEFHPRPLAVQVKIPLELDPIVKARSEVFAMRRIREAASLKDALARAGAAHNADAIRAVYRKIAGDLPETQPPPKSARETAKEWLAG